MLESSGSGECDPEWLPTSLPVITAELLFSFGVRRRAVRRVHLLLVAAGLATVHATAGAVDDGDVLQSGAAVIAARRILVLRPLRAAAPWAAAGFDQHRHVDIGGAFR